MRVLVACEYSGKVRAAFRARGHEAWSCDLLPTDDGSIYHFEGDILEVLGWSWDLMVAFPPCTDLCSSGARWFPEKIADGRQQRALNFVHTLMTAPIEKIAIENPVGVISSTFGPPTQYVQPWMFGHGETKKTGLWLKGLAPLTPTDVVEGREQRIWKMGPSATRWKERSETLDGLAHAMAEQWG